MDRLITIGFVLGLCLALGTCSYSYVSSVQIKADAAVTIAKERTERAQSRHELIDRLIRRRPAEESP